MTTPVQKPHRSRQDYQTPPELIAAVMRDFAAVFSHDLAATEDTAIKMLTRFHLGPGSPMEEKDSLAVDWSTLQPGTDCWLNPPFANIAPWAQKCARTERKGRIFMLVPASVGSNWYRDHVDGKAHVVAISPRVTFVGEKDPYPKDLILAVYGPVRGGFSTWRWQP